MTQTLSVETVQKLIIGDLNACQSLLTLLDKETKLLQARDVEGLAQLLEEKAPLLAQLEKSAEVRGAWAKSQNITDISSAWQKLFDQLKSEKLADDWKKLKALLSTCKEKNEINGKTLIRSQKVFTRLLGIIRGQNSASSLYNATGSSSGAVRTQIVGEA